MVGAGPYKDGVLTSANLKECPTPRLTTARPTRRRTHVLTAEGKAVLDT